jgi:ferredoxin
MKHKYLRNVATLVQDTDACKDCGICLNVCPHQVFGKSASAVRITNLNACIECGACVRNCPFQALNVEAGVGCAQAIINGLIYGTEPNCDCGGGGSSDCC